MNITNILEQYNVSCTLLPEKKGNYKYFQSVIKGVDKDGQELLIRKRMPANRMLPDKIGFKKAMQRTTDKALEFLSQYYKEQLPLCPKITQ